jgi:glycosyltransferase involved in cell wall biosynthesis
MFRLQGRAVLRLLTPALIFYTLFTLWTSFGSITEDTADIYQDLSKPGPKTGISTRPGHSKDQPKYAIIIDGIIFRLQGGKPKGISVVWKNLLMNLPSVMGSEDQIYFLDPEPGQSICMEIVQNTPELIHLPYSYNMAEVVKKSVLPKVGNRIVVFMSTYYTSYSGLCQILMYHDLIPEKVGMDTSPGSEYYPRIDALTKVNSIVSVSYSTSRDLLELYGDKVKNTNEKDDDTEFTKGSIVRTIQNRISRDVFKGVASEEEVSAFANDNGLFMLPGSYEHLPYFISVGSSYHYKNHDTLFKAIGLLPAQICNRIAFVLSGRTHSVSDSERKMLGDVRLIVRHDDGTEEMFGSEQAEKIVRIRYVHYMKDQDLGTAYTASLGLIYISSYEGFGLPVAEAITSGTLAITTNSSSLPEVGGPDSIYVNNPRDPEELMQKMVQVFSMKRDERQRRIENGLVYVERFGGGENGEGHGWEEMAYLLMKHIRSHKHRGNSCYTPNNVS